MVTLIWYTVIIQLKETYLVHEPLLLLWLHGYGIMIIQLKEAYLVHEPLLLLWVH